ncbi:hypothetical protein BJV77DRAFT_1068736 [Russula vinacea]|nr:hypothetical protein BJV77DRAFT_1068736 [Russula vinacea]
MQVDVPREPAPLPILAFLHPAFDDVLAAAPPLCFPMHEQDVIHAFLKRVRNIDDDVHECATMRTSNIATTPQTAYAGEIMPELYDIINSITQIEEMEILRSLVRLASSCG